MTKKATAVETPNEWENPNGSNDEYESLPTGLSPLWKPKEGEIIFFRPDTVHPFKVKKGKKSKKIKGTNFAIEGILVDGTRDDKGKLVNLGHFSNGKKDVEMSLGDRVTLGSSHNMIGVDRLIVVEDSGPKLSPMAELILNDKKQFRIRFDGKIAIGGGHTVNQLDIAVPKGYRDKLREVVPKTPF